MCEQDSCDIRTTRTEQENSGKGMHCGCCRCGGGGGFVDDRPEARCGEVRDKTTDLERMLVEEARAVAFSFLRVSAVSGQVNVIRGQSRWPSTAAALYVLVHVCPALPCLQSSPRPQPGRGGERWKTSHKSDFRQAFFRFFIHLPAKRNHGQKITEVTQRAVELSICQHTDPYPLLVSSYMYCCSPL